MLLGFIHGLAPPILVGVLILVAVGFIVFKLIRFFAFFIALAVVVFIAWQMGLFDQLLGLAMPALL